jgi:enoyl-[acyl-carrier protein] reductase II
MGAISVFPELAATVSNAGGLGCIAGATMPTEQLQERIRRFRELSDRPFAVNFPIVLTPEKQIGPKMQLMLDEKVPVVITSAGNPKLWTKYLQDGGCRVAHVLPTLYHAQKAAEAGVDAIIAEPAESGGYRGEHEVSMMVLIPIIRRAFPGIPLIAAGAVADGAGLAGVMALGAEGVQLGTRFLATEESTSADYVKKLILAANDTSTMSAEGRVKPRVSKPEFAESVLGERKQSQMGQVSALINDIKSVEQVMKELIEGGFEASRRATEGLAELSRQAAAV